MPPLIGLGIVGIILYFLIIGGILIWPLINIIAYLKVLIFPRAVRKKYGSSITVLSNNSFDQEITNQDHSEIENLSSLTRNLNIRRIKLNNELAALG